MGRSRINEAYRWVTVISPIWRWRVCVSGLERSRSVVIVVGFRFGIDRLTSWMHMRSDCASMKSVYRLSYGNYTDEVSWGLLGEGVTISEKIQLNNFHVHANSNMNKHVNLYYLRKLWNVPRLVFSTIMWVENWHLRISIQPTNKRWHCTSNKNKVQSVVPHHTNRRVGNLACIHQIVAMRWHTYTGLVCIHQILYSHISTKNCYIIAHDRSSFGEDLYKGPEQNYVPILSPHLASCWLNKAYGRFLLRAFTLVQLYFPLSSDGPPCVLFLSNGASMFVLP
jgi:hypothetical protein